MNRFIYYPNHLVRMPGPGVPFFDILYAIFNEPLFNGIPFDFGLEAIRSQRPKELLDESVGSFLARRYSPALADNIASAVLHGIYAGDVYKLSVKSLLPLLWFFEEQYGSIARGIWKSFISKSLPMLEQDAVLMKELMAKPILTSKLHDLRGASVYTFKRGIGELADQLEVKLKEASNVDVKMEMSIGKIEHDGRSRGVKVRIHLFPSRVDQIRAPVKMTPSQVYAQKTGSLLSSPPHIRTHTHTISTLSSSKMAYLCGNESLPTLSKTHSVTVMVVNMYFSNPNLLSFHGFGYLIPRSVPFEQNPERALGVVFDSDATIGQDTVLGTKVTVMLGGHWWDGWDSYPDEDEGRQMGLAILHRHLKITEQPTAVLVGLQRECIPQYFVGHDLRMATASQDLEKKYKGRLRVAGNSYTGVGLNDCVRAARDVVKGLVARDGVMRTGLESFTEERIWVKAVAVPRKPS